MYLNHVAVEGLAHPAEAHASGLTRSSALPDGPEGGALVDALSLLRAALDADSMERHGAADLRASEVQREGPLLDQVSGLSPGSVGALVGRADPRQVRITADLIPDPPSWRGLREHAARDPRLATALGEGARLSLRVGWLFNRAGDTASVSLLGLTVGQTDFTATTRERPAWLVSVAHDLGRRIGLVRADAPDLNLGERLLSAHLSPDPALRARAAALSRTFALPPFGWGALELLRVGWLFNRAGDTASVSLLGLTVGQTDFTATTRERPAWLVSVAHDLGRRIGLVRADAPDLNLGERLLSAHLSPDPALRARAAALSRTFALPPFGWGALELLREGERVELVVGDALTPIRRLGPRAMLAAQLGVAAWLDAPDVLVLTHPLRDDDPLLGWLGERVTADDATLEQLLTWGGLADSEEEGDNEGSGP